jgi:hypothetical protein
MPAPDPFAFAMGLGRPAVSGSDARFRLPETVGFFLLRFVDGGAVSFMMNSTGVLSSTA